jgi:DNA-binding MarR family transcriptional regulator
LLVGISARCISDVEEGLTIPQFRTLVVLSNVGPVNIETLARLLGLPPSMVGSMVERLVVAGLVVSVADSASRRGQVADLSSRGRTIVSKVTAGRREEIADIVTVMPARRRAELLRAFMAFAEAGGQLALDVDGLL